MLGLCLKLMRAAIMSAATACTASAQIAGHSSTGATQTLTLTGTAQSLTVPSGTVWATICIEVANRLARVIE
jgi:hypothetical protein